MIATKPGSSSNLTSAGIPVTGAQQGPSMPSQLPPPPKPTVLNLEAVMKDVNSVVQTCFNHREMLNAEIKHFIKEFEDKREDYDIQALQKLPIQLEKTMNLIDEQWVQSMSPAENIATQLKEMNELLTLQLQKEEKILEERMSEQLHRQTIDEAERKRFEKEINDETEAIDRAFVEQSDAQLKQHNEILNQLRTQLQQAQARYTYSPQSQPPSSSNVQPSAQPPQPQS